mgnify:CR=1 FL=1
MKNGNTSVLIVDDQVIVRETTAQLLRLKGYEVVTEESGTAAVEYYRESWESLDVVILDMNMPVMSGHEALMAMRQINADVKALFYTGDNLDDRADEPLIEGPVSYIQKPFRNRDLIEKINQVLS